MRNTLLSVLFILTSGITGTAFAQNGGLTAYRFLGLPPSARTTALGGNLISVMDDDLNNAVQNPALLNPSMHNQIVANTANFLSDIRYGYVAYAHHMRNTGTFSAGVQSINYGDFNETNENGDVLGSFTARENMFHLSYANQYHQFSYGTSLKYVGGSYESYHSGALLFDLGGTYFDTVSNFTASFVLKNIGWQVQSLYGEKEAMPFEAQFGLSKRLKHAPFRFSLIAHNLQKFDLTYYDPNDPDQEIDLATGLPIRKNYNLADKLARHLIIGTEVIFSKNFQVRVGYDHQRRKELALKSRASTAGFSWGFGLKIKKVGFSYGSARYHLAGSTNMFSISVNPNDFLSRKKS